ncbi:MAG: PAS domain S-box protein [SAR324 cluster bacterium]|nr:PAS domain S-box protein [SAR324 cluster bacterium]
MEPANDGLTTKLSAKILGQIVLIQGMVWHLPNLESILSFVCRGLENLPGVFQIGYQVFEENFERGGLAEDGSKTGRKFELKFKDTVFGEMTFSVSESALFAPYIPYIENLSLMLAVVCEERRQRVLIESYKNELEKRVYDRTKQLEMEIDVRRQTEESLRESEKKFKSIFEQAAVGFALVESKTGCFIRINKRFCEIIGYTVDEMSMNKTFQEITHSDDLQKDLGNNARLVAGEIHEFTTEKRYIHKSGSIVWVRLTISPTWQKGEEPHSHIAVVEDITERKHSEDALRKSEEELRAIFSAAKEVSFIITDAKEPDSTVLEFSPGAESIFGYKRSEMLGKCVSALHLPEDIVKMPEMHKAIREGRKGFSGETTMVRKSGEEFPALFSIYPLLDENGEMYAALNVSFDIGKQKKLEAQLQQTQKMEAIGTLAGGIAHDFNNMLGIITGNISYVLTELEKSGEIYRALLDAQQGASQARYLTQQLLTFAKGGAPVKKTINPNQLVKESAELAKRGSNSICRFKLSDDSWFVEVDPGQINQVISNLIINANQAMPDGGTIEVHSENIILEKDDGLPLPGGRYIKISIEDQGVGISKKHLSKIFEPFFSTKQKGSGLGLAITFSVVKMHNGYIAAESELGKGSIFSIYLPATSKEVTQTKDRETANHFGRGRVLIMDDQESILNMLGRMLKKMGYETTFAVDGSEAVEKYQEAGDTDTPFDLVILDLTIPGGMGGAATVSELLNIDPGVRAVVSSGYSNNPVMANFQDYGFSGVLSKPYTQMQLAEVLNKILGQ